MGRRLFFLIIFLLFMYGMVYVDKRLKDRRKEQTPKVEFAPMKSLRPWTGALLPFLQPKKCLGCLECDPGFLCSFILGQPMRGTASSLPEARHRKQLET